MYKFAGGRTLICWLLPLQRHSPKYIYIASGFAVELNQRVHRYVWLPIFEGGMARCAFRNLRGRSKILAKKICCRFQKVFGIWYPAASRFVLMRLYCTHFRLIWGRWSQIRSLVWEIYSRIAGKSIFIQKFPWKSIFLKFDCEFP